MCPKSSFWLPFWYLQLFLSQPLFQVRNLFSYYMYIWGVWRYQRGNDQNPYIEKEQTTQWPKDKGQKDKQLSTIHAHKTKDRVTRTPIKTGGELRCSRRVSSSCSTTGTRCVNLVTNPMISYEWGKDREVFTTRGSYPWSFVTHIFNNGQPSHGGDRKTFEVMTCIIYH